MKKPSGPELTITPPALKLCERCQGYGIEKPMLHELVCGGCGGAGFVDQETGAAVDPGVALVALNRALRKAKWLVVDLRREASTDYDHYGALNERYGGLARGD